MKKLFLSFLLVFVTLVSAVADDSPKAVIIFDASGSMWGQIQGKTKIEIAKKALENVVKEWNPKVELGLTVYGHRKKGDCNDIESLIPVGKVDKSKIISTVNKIQPKGKTPIARSLKKVADELKYTEEKATIILISDGQESCDANPCDVAKELEKKGIDFVTHVIGFNVDKKTDKELECIAKATGGEYFSAKNATALNSAIKSIAKKVEKEESKPTPKPVIKKLKDTVEVVVTEKEGGKWIVASSSIYKDNNGEKGQYVTGLTSYKNKAGKAKIPVGKYILKTIYNKFKKETPFEVKVGEVTKLKVIMGQTGKVEVVTTEREGGKWIVASSSIYKENNGEKGQYVTGLTSYKNKAGKAKIPVGKYILKTIYNKFKKETPFEVKAGEVTKLKVIMGQTGKVEVVTTEKEGGKWVVASSSIYKDDNGEKGQYITGLTSYKNKAGKAKIPVGKYILKTTYNKFKKETPFEVKAGEVTKLKVVFEKFIIVSKCTNHNAKIHYEIYATSGQLVKDIRLVCSKPLQLTLDRGDYNIEANLKDIKKEAKFTIGGDSNKLILDFTDIDNHKDLIQADSPNSNSEKEKEALRKKEEIEKVVKDNEAVVKDIDKKSAEEIKKAGALLNALGGLVQGLNQQSTTEQKEKKSTTDKEFEDMSKNLDMFTK